MPLRPYLGTHPVLGEGVYIDPTALVIGDVVLGDQVSIWPMVVVRGDVNGIRIGALVLDGVEVESDVVIGAGAVVTPGKRLESRGLYVGNPARRLRDLTDVEVERIPTIAAWYVNLKKDYQPP